MIDPSRIDRRPGCADCGMRKKRSDFTDEVKIFRPFQPAAARNHDVCLCDIHLGSFFSYNLGHTTLDFLLSDDDVFLDNLSAPS